MKTVLSNAPTSCAKLPMLDVGKTIRSVLVLIATSFILSLTFSAQTVTTLHTFNGADGSVKIPALIQSTDGNFYGTTESGGTDNSGTVFKMTPQGTLTTLYSFCGAITGCGRVPFAGLVRGTDGNFYGAAAFGGTNINCSGTLFKITAQGILTTLYVFCSPQSSGQFPEAALVQAHDGNFYGTTAGGNFDLGTLFRMSPHGELTTLHRFCTLPCADGSFPNGPGLLHGADGNLYGITSQGGGRGTIFKSTLSGVVSTLHSFCPNSGCTDGNTPEALAQSLDGTIYGVTYAGGSARLCTTFDGCGTIFKITPSGQFRTVYSFCQQLSTFYCADGEAPTSLVLGSDGNLYGTTQYGGVPKNGGLAIGTIFRSTPDGTVTTLYTFCNQNYCPDGAWPGNLVQSTDGSFFGATEALTASGSGTIFKLDAGLLPFVKTMPRFGKVGASVIIVGNKLSSATSVSFNGTAAAFTVLSNNEIKATVPAGATTGQLTVTTAQGSLASDVVFTVVP